MVEKILVIKHGALGDFILATAAFKAIREHHSNADIILLTTRPYVKLAEASGFFNAVVADTRPKLWNIFKLYALRGFLTSGFSRIYDLQNSDRTTLYFNLIPKSITEWSGRIAGCKYYQGEYRETMHTLPRLADQLKLAGVAAGLVPDISWLKGDISSFGLPENFALIAAGGSAHRPEKRWSDAGFTEVANRLFASGITPVFIGTEAEGEKIKGITASVSGAISLLGRTDFGQIAELSRKARLAIGNDTGPMHIIAATGCPSFVLFSKHSDPERCAPLGRNVKVIRRDNLDKLKAFELMEALANPPGRGW